MVLENWSNILWNIPFHFNFCKYLLYSSLKSITLVTNNNFFPHFRPKYVVLTSLCRIIVHFRFAYGMSKLTTITLLFIQGVRTTSYPNLPVRSIRISHDAVFFIRDGKQDLTFSLVNLLIPILFDYLKNVIQIVNNYVNYFLASGRADFVFSFVAALVELPVSC